MYCFHFCVKLKIVCFGTKKVLKFLVSDNRFKSTLLGEAIIVPKLSQFIFIKKMYLYNSFRFLEMLKAFKRRFFYKSIGNKGYTDLFIRIFIEFQISAASKNFEVKFSKCINNFRIIIVKNTFYL